MEEHRSRRNRSVVGRGGSTKSVASVAIPLKRILSRKSKSGEDGDEEEEASGNWHLHEIPSCCY